MKLLLTSNGLCNKSLAQIVKKSVKKPIKIAFIPTASNLINEDKNWLVNDLCNCVKLGSVDVVDISAIPKSSWLPRLKKANVIVVGGGDTAYLREKMASSGFDKDIPKLLKSKLYVGISAGSIVTNKTLLASSENLYNVGERKSVAKGLGLVNFYIRPHLNSPDFPKVRDKNLKKIVKKIDRDLYALDDNSGVLVVNGKIKVISEGKWILYKK